MHFQALGNAANVHGFLIASENMKIWTKQKTLYSKYFPLQLEKLKFSI